MRTPALRLLLVLASTAILTACGGSSKPSRSIHVTMTDFMFTPNSFTVPAGAEVKYTAENSGAVAHSFIIMKLGYSVRGHFTPADEANVYWQQEPIEAGKSVESSFTAPTDAGEYQIVCGTAGHFEAGMVAKLVVVKEP